jgi:hypothetical protein
MIKRSGLDQQQDTKRIVCNGAEMQQVVDSPQQADQGYEIQYKLSINNHLE